MGSGRPTAQRQGLCRLGTARPVQQLLSFGRGQGQGRERTTESHAVLLLISDAGRAVTYCTDIRLSTVAGCSDTLTVFPSCLGVAPVAVKHGCET
jgi:hypothetical protein